MEEKNGRKLCVISNTILGLVEPRVVILGLKKYYAGTKDFFPQIVRPLGGQSEIPGLKKIKNGNGEEWEFHLKEFLQKATVVQTNHVAKCCGKEISIQILGGDERQTLFTQA